MVTWATAKSTFCLREPSSTEFCFQLVSNWLWSSKASNCCVGSAAEQIAAADGGPIIGFPRYYAQQAAAAELWRSAAEGESMDVATWNVLHDGRVIAADRSVPGDLRLSVEIAYLCHHLPTKAEHLVVTLVGCERFQYRPYGQPPLAEPSAIAALGL